MHLVGHFRILYQDERRHEYQPFFDSDQCCIYLQTDCLTLEWYSCSNFITYNVQSNCADSGVQSVFIVSDWTYVWLSATVQRAHTTVLSKDCIFKRQFFLTKWGVPMFCTRRQTEKWCTASRYATSFLILNICLEVMTYESIN